ncbi:MAG: radical SAM protein [Nanoarchaeota archaeon]|nr:radical SAM protein [Nanoarchaeota archaeon]
MKKSDFTFIIPNTSWFEKRYWHNFPYTEGLLASVLKKEGYEVNIIDANINNLSEGQLEQKISEINPTNIGIGAMTLEYKDCVHKSFEIVKKVNPSIKTTLGGIYPTLSPEIATKDTNIDFFVFGEGEERLPKLLNAIETGKGFEDIDGLSFRKDGNLISIPKSGGIINLDSLPFPDYSGFDMNKYMNYQQKFTQNFKFKQLPVGITMTSRGCPFRCTFCSSKELYDSKVRTRSPENVLKEIDMLTDKYGMRELIFVDDSLLLPKERALKIMDGLIERKKKGSDLVWKSNNLAIHNMDEEVLSKMKESGCYQVIVSIESGSKNTLERMKKPVNLDRAMKTLEKIKDVGFEDVSSNFVIGMPGDTWEDIRESFRCVEEMVDKSLLDYVVFHIATPFPRTELYNICRENKYIPSDFSFEDPKYYGFGKGIITTPEFTPPELQNLRAFEWDRINFKTPEKREKISKMLGITLDELEVWRKETRRAVGLNVRSADKNDLK